MLSSINLGIIEFLLQTLSLSKSGAQVLPTARVALEYFYTYRNYGCHYPGSMSSKVIFNDIRIIKSSRPEVFCKKGVLKNFARFTGKPLCLKPATLLKKRLWHRFFPVNFAKFLRTYFYRTPLVAASE